MTAILEEGISSVFGPAEGKRHCFFIDELK